MDLSELEDILYNQSSALEANYDYRIPGDNISLLEFVDKVCKDHGYDWQFYLEVNEGINPNNTCNNKIKNFQITAGN